MIKKILNFLPFIFIFVIALVLFYPTFNLALWGDDWYVFWRSTRLLESRDLGNWNYISLFFTTYGPMDVLVGTFMRYLFGLNSTFYYVTSFIFRFLAALSLYPLILFITKNKFAAFFGMLFFSITVIGIETSAIVVLIPTFIGIIFLNLFLLFYLQARENFNQNCEVLLASIFFILAFVTAPIRMTGLVPLILAVEIFGFIKNRRNRTLKRASLQRLIILVSIFIVLTSTNIFSSIGTEIGEANTPKNLGLKRTEDAVRIMTDSFKQGDFKFLLNPIITTGYMLFPYSRDGEDPNQVLSLITGISVFIIGAALIMRYRRDAFLPGYIFLSLALIILGFIMPWMWDFKIIYPVTHRYLIISAIGVSIFLAVIFGITKRKGSRIIVFTLLGVILFLQIISTSKYLSARMLLHSQSIDNKLWSNIPYMPEITRTDKPIIFYMQNDGYPPYMLLQFGLNYRIGFLYRLDTYRKLPIIALTWDQVLSDVKDGKSIPEGRNYPVGPVPVENIYSFTFDKDRLVNNTDQVREELRKQISGKIDFW